MNKYFALARLLTGSKFWTSSLSNEHQEKKFTSRFSLGTIAVFDKHITTFGLGHIVLSPYV